MRRYSLWLMMMLALAFLPVQASAQGFLGIVQAYQAGRQARMEEEIARQQAEQLRLQNEMMRQDMERETAQDRREQKERYQADRMAADRREQGRQRQQEQAAKARQAAFEYFVQNVKPIVLKVHPDFDSIVAGQGYWEWAEKQRPALKFAAFNSGDPGDIIWAMSEYKAFMRGAEASRSWPALPLPEKLTTR